MGKKKVFLYVSLFLILVIPSFSNGEGKEDMTMLSNIHWLGDDTFKIAGDKITVEGIAIEAVPSYNTNKQFHTKDKNWVGYIFTVKGQRIYLAGDTDYIPEMKTFSNVDIALLPVSGTYVMTADEAVKAALDIKPKIAIPMHYGSIVGSENDAERFAKGLKGKIEVKILQQE